MVDAALRAIAPTSNRAPAAMRRTNASGRAKGVVVSALQPFAVSLCLFPFNATDNKQETTSAFHFHSLPPLLQVVQAIGRAKFLTNEAGVVA